MSRIFDKLFDTIAQCWNVIMIFGEKVEQSLEEMFVGYYFLRAIYDIRFKLRMHFRVTFITKQAELVVGFSTKRFICEVMDIQFHVDRLTRLAAKLCHLSWWQTRRRRSSSLSLTSARRPNTARNFHNQVPSISYWGNQSRSYKSSILFVLFLLTPNHHFQTEDTFTSSSSARSASIAS